MRTAMCLAMTALVGLLAVIAPVAAAGAKASIATAHCAPPGNGQGPKNDASLPIGLVTVHDMSCRAARGAIRAGTFAVRGGCFGISRPGPCRTFFKTPGFRCRAPALGEFRCTDRARRFIFGWGE